MRRLLLPAILIAAAFLAFSIREDRGAQTPTAAASADIVSPGTPMLSARRIPDVLSEPRAFELVELDLQLVASQMPSLSCLVAHDADGRDLFSTQGQVGLAPASLQKLVTANAVLQHLGPDFTFRTAVMATSAPVDGVLEGDLFLIGGGDPLFHSEAYVASYPRAFPYTSADALADTLVGLGITTITGGVVANETRYDNLRQPTAWDGTSLARDGNTGPLGAMMLNDGFVAFPAVREPGIFSTPAADPALHAAQAFDDLLEARAVTIRGGSRNVAELPAGLIEIANIESLPLIEIVDEMLTFSDNAPA
ncbi:MAG: D-alanyl-D-alanine carboxypeptidase [Acidimicrobiales bacterium]